MSTVAATATGGATVVTSGTSAAPGMFIATPAPSTDTLLTMGDLILRNPMQSTGIFFIIIFCSTGLEYVFELLQSQRNAYLRNIIHSTKEELAAVAFSQMVLIFLSLVVGFSETARSVVLLATLMIVYICLNFSIYVVMVNVLQSRRSKEWSTFEWGRLERDALHTKQEALFKAARSVFLRRAKCGARVRAALSDGKEGPTSVMPVLFASYLGHVERSYLKESFDFTWVTWTALIGIVIADGLRSIAVNSTSGKGDVAATQILTFVFVIGWGLLLLLLAARYFQTRRLSQYVRQWNLIGTFADVTSANPSSGSGSSPDNSYNGERKLHSGHDADTKPVKTDGEFSDKLLENFYFNSVSGALSVFQVLMLGMLWFSCVFTVGMVHLSWITFGWPAIFIYAAAAVPFFTAVFHVLPNALTDVFIVAAISCDFDDDLVTRSVNGEYDLRQLEAESDEDEDAEDAQTAAASANERTRQFSPGLGLLEKTLLAGDGGAGECDDEIDAPVDQVALGQGRTGAAPVRVIGVPPPPKPTSGFVWAQRRPIFSAPMGSAGL